LFLIFSLRGVSLIVQSTLRDGPFLHIPIEQRLEMGIWDGMIRVSTGLEDVEDLIADFDAALALL
jgi:cystathionine beta-lyase/cystathionine gamma-synthase